MKKYDIALHVSHFNKSVVSIYTHIHIQYIYICSNTHDAKNPFSKGIIYASE